jgi:hypothetical protein
MNKQVSKINFTLQAQQGYFTTKQAIAAGYSARTHNYHVGTGAWIREHRGIYRLAQYPDSPEGHYVLWSLWSRNRQDIPQGVFSHHTALSIHELSDIMPAKLHLTVPPGFRRNSEIPNILQLHRAALSDQEIEQRHGFRVVRPLRAINDLIKEGALSRDHLRQALQQASSRGLITRLEIKNNPLRQHIEALLSEEKM